ncbi:hypothetical protein [Mycoplasma seminis]|uniref:IS30 family transposase n=1 Tax=Mycoplasma seminis TaxID=512749 RepID=A0ABY9HAU7_9MOLU|nr:hypothetical protein [Mycoplasma seminis]WLP85305.1 hypothetical protein Q8852_03205 [Mycoplasma seminis]
MDNGLENSELHKVKSIKEFYVCDPYSSWQKGSLENAHKEIRKIIPKGYEPQFICENFIFELIDSINKDKQIITLKIVNI